MLRIDRSLDTISSTYSYVFLGLDKSGLEECRDERLGVIENSDFSSVVGFLRSYIEDEVVLQEEVSVNTLALSLKNKDIGCALLSYDLYESLSDTHYLKATATLIHEHKEIEVLPSLFQDTVHVLVSGIDQLGSAKYLGRSDMNMIISFNMKRKEVLLTSIPRDSYVESVCRGNRFDKLTHTSNDGIGCTVKSVERLLGIRIPYYIRVSFSSVIEGVDLLDGLVIDVPMTFCEYDEYKRVVYIDKGKQTLTGTEVLALARHRYTLVEGDMDRNRNHQLIIKALLAKTMQFQTVFVLEDLLRLAERTVDTNFTSDQIYEFIMFQMEDTRRYALSTQNLTGYNRLRMTASVPHVPLSVLEISQDSLVDVREKLKEIEQDITLEEFRYSVESDLGKEMSSIPRGTNQCHIK
ncbi:MAG: LCP family protein [Erysipelotrichales bacterium]|nr:LCP family protein [Erysipelotrichales bacterium]